MAPRKKLARNQRQTTESSIHAQVNRVLGKLIEQEPRLKASLSRAIDDDNGATDIADQIIQIYRQKLREK